ncbi:MAG TPA: thioredoxin domain-containing protein [Pyrinomonadaceae bacterium]|nr:thioredoxin domain-containing protein [Pyrinomonadaceae bacterium]
MANEKKQANSGLPLAIIVGVLVAVVIGGWWFYSSSANKPKGNTNKASATQKPTVPTNAPIGAQPPNLLGSPTALVTVEEFADFQCPTCASVHPAVKEIQSIYGSRIKFIFRNFPLQMHDKAYDAAVAAEAAGLQGSDKFWAMQNQLFSNQQTWANDPNYRQVFADYAQKIGLDTAKFDADTRGLVAKQRVDEDLRRARGLNVGSTPTIYINGEAVPPSDMNVTAMRQLIDAEIQKTNAAQSQGEKPAAANANASK